MLESGTDGKFLVFGKKLEDVYDKIYENVPPCSLRVKMTLNVETARLLNGDRVKLPHRAENQMIQRKQIPKAVETEVLLASRRRCCLCVYLEHRDGVRKGQIAHLNHDSSDPRFENLVYLCFEHHDEYDGTTSQAKGLTSDEVRAYRNRLYGQGAEQNKWMVQSNEPFVKDLDADLIPRSIYAQVRKSFPDAFDFTQTPWHFALWQSADEPEFFAYKAGNHADGVCLIERIDLPDGRIVIACIQTAGNPGNSITNCVEELCFQVCERFEIPANRLVWLEHYDYWDEWSMVTFGQIPPQGPFADPKWVDMTPELWRDLRLRPKRKMRSRRGDFYSKLTKLFPWPPADLALIS